MIALNFKDAPIKVYGIPFFEEHKSLYRLPPEVRAEVPSLEFLGQRCPGGRLAFRTDSWRFTVKITFATLGVDVGMSLYACQSAAALVWNGDRNTARYAGLANPHGYAPENKTFEGTFYKSGEMEDVTIYLPRNEIITDITLGFEDGAKIEAPTPYKHKPVMFYGSSITEGGCCCNLNCTYNAILSTRLDADYYNFGFSGSAKGELAVADYINKIEMSAFVYDYDHNAPNEEHLSATHEPFFLRIREKHPDLPVIMMSMPKEIYDDGNKRRRDIIKATYENALARGDKNVYFIDGETFYGETERHLCSIDTIHPNDLGFYRMANTVEPVLRAALGIE